LRVEIKSSIYLRKETKMKYAGVIVGKSLDKIKRFAKTKDKFVSFYYGL